MSDYSAQHSSIVLMRTYPAPIARVFAAVTDPLERMRMHAGSEHLTIEFEEIGLRAGGRDVFRFGSGGDLRFRGECLYHDIARERRIVSTDTVWAGDTRLWVGLTTLEFKSHGQRTQLKATAHIAWLDGAEAIDGADARHAALLEDLGNYLSDEARFRPRLMTTGRRNPGGRR